MTQEKARSNSLSISCALVSCVLGFMGCAVIPRSALVAPSDIHKVSGTYRGIVHVHSDFSTGNSKITLSKAIQTAEKAGYDFVVITDHNSVSKGKAAYLQSSYSKYPLLIFGNEITTQDGHLLALGVDTEPPAWDSTQQLVDWIHAQGGYAVPAHAFSRRTPWTNWSIRGLDGLEIYNFAHAFYTQNKLKLFWKLLFYSPRGFTKSSNQISDPALNEWDRLSSQGQTAAFGGSDAHLHYRGLENLMLYFQGVSMYVVSPSLDERSITKGLAEGRSYLAFEARGKASEFEFKASSGGRNYEIGDSIASSNRTRFEAVIPKNAEIRLIQNGRVIARANAKTILYETAEHGVFRVEVYHRGKLWILSNPIYVKSA